MVDALVRDLAFLLIIWQIWISFQQWHLIRAALQRLARQRDQKRRPAEIQNPNREQHLFSIIAQLLHELCDGCTSLS